MHFLWKIGENISIVAVLSNSRSHKIIQTQGFKKRSSFVLIIGWSSAELGFGWRNPKKGVNKSWTNFEHFINKTWKNSEQVGNKSWRSHEKEETIYGEQFLQLSYEQVMN